MHHVKVESSQIHSIGYDPVEQKLSVRFLCNTCKGKDCDDECAKCGGDGHSSTYEYDDVPQEHYVALRDEKESIGKKFGSLIKGGGFKFKKVHG